MTATPEDVMTIRLTEGSLAAALRMLVVPLIAGAMMSRSKSSVGMGSGDAMCKMAFTPLTASS